MSRRVRPPVVSTAEAWLVWVTVGGAEILFGVPGLCWFCPVARAIQNALRPGFSVEVGSHSANILEKATDGIVGSFDLPPFVTEFIETFDSQNGLPECRPFSMMAPIPRRALRADVRVVATEESR